MLVIKSHSRKKKAIYSLFGALSLALLVYYLSNSLIHFTTPWQFPVNSFTKYPLTILIFPAEAFSLLFGAYFVYVLLNDKPRPAPKELKGKKSKRVAILIPVYNEPKALVERTVKACRKVKWPGGTRLFLLDDSDNAERKREVEALASRHGCKLVRRDDRAGYKAGNVNNAVKRHVSEEFFLVLDSDQAPHPSILLETMNHFSDEKVAFVQTPQHFLNEDTALERAVKLGTNLFFQAMCNARDKDGATVFCGTNAVIRRKAFEEVNGFSYYTATEDIDLGLRMNDKGYKGAYVSKVLANGYSPKDFSAYSSQQYRWSNGNLAILRENWLKILLGNLSLKQKIHSFLALGWWLIGVVSLVFITVPLLALTFNLETHHTWLSDYVLVFLYVNVFLGLLMIHLSVSNRVSGVKARLRDALLQYSLLTNSLFIYVKAAINALLKNYAGFVRTKKVKSKTGLGNVKWNLATAALTFTASIYALYEAGVSGDFERTRRFLPLSLWLLFYTVVLASSIFFVEVPFLEGGVKG